MVRWIATTVLALLLTVSSAQAAEPNVALDELKERCRIYAAEVFAKDYGDHLKIEGKDIYYNYQAHYNAHLNKCFFLEIAAILEKKNDMALTYRLFDLFEKREYGSYTQSTQGAFFCKVQETVCRSKSEWDNLIKPYMDE